MILPTDIIETRKRARKGEYVSWVEGTFPHKRLHRGYINGIYPYVCEIVEVFNGVRFTRCLQWQDLINKV